MSDSGPTSHRTPPLFVAMVACIVLGVFGLAFAVLMPSIISSPRSADFSADAAQLRMFHYQWLQLHRMRHDGQPPSAGGCRFVLNSWTSGVVDHTVENFDKYFSPGARDNDANYLRKRALVLSGKDPWPTQDDVTSADTHYVGRAQEHLATAYANPGEALMANDNENGWTFRDGDINVLFADGDVRMLSYAMLQERFGLGRIDRDVPVKTWGPDSPIPECRKLAND